MVSPLHLIAILGLLVLPVAIAVLLDRRLRDR